MLWTHLLLACACGTKGRSRFLEEVPDAPQAERKGQRWGWATGVKHPTKSSLVPPHCPCYTHTPTHSWHELEAGPLPAQHPHAYCLSVRLRLGHGFQDFPRPPGHFLLQPLCGGTSAVSQQKAPWSSEPPWGGPTSPSCRRPPPLPPPQQGSDPHPTRQPHFVTVLLSESQGWVTGFCEFVFIACDPSLAFTKQTVTNS